jgi:hypothetical protein
MSYPAPKRRWFAYEKEDPVRHSTIALIVLIAAAFGCLMAARDAFDNIWLRALIAAIAFGGSALAVGWLYQRREVKN